MRDPFFFGNIDIIILNQLIINYTCRKMRDPFIFGTLAILTVQGRESRGTDAVTSKHTSDKGGAPNLGHAEHEPKPLDHAEHEPNP